MQKTILHRLKYRIEEISDFSPIRRPAKRAGVWSNKTARKACRYLVYKYVEDSLLCRLLCNGGKMGLQDTVSGERLHIGFFGMRNAGKSSLVNKITGQQLAVVSDIKGTTTDPVKKAMELLPLGPVVIMDTPGLDDEGILGELRVEKTRQILAQTDIAVLVVDASAGLGEQDEELIRTFAERKIPYLLVYNKVDLVLGQAAVLENEATDTAHGVSSENVVFASTVTGEGIEKIKEKLGSFAREKQNPKLLVSDMIEQGDIVVLVTPIDESAPKGRLILPQQLTIRDILDKHGIVVTCQDTQLAQILCSLSKKPKMVITDSQVFGKVSKDVPEDVPLTSFSILMARYKGDLKELVKGAAALSRLRDGDKVLISEGCTHHRQCNDIGTVKMPNWMKEFTNADLEFSFTSGGEFPEDLSVYSVVVHCGGCTLNEAQMKHRIKRAVLVEVPIVNYGIAIAHMHGILKRSVELFPDVYAVLEK